MYYAENEARELIIKAGHRLQDTGLIARTWGNISARISESQYIITPSGMAYDTLKPEQLVKVNIHDGKYEGDIKPSGEKAVHAAVYMLKPDVRFIVHTHQVYASVVGVTGKDIPLEKDPVLGDVVPCAAYGMPSTGKLCRNVINAIRAHKDCKAILMMRHGTLCMGNSPEEAFQVAEQLENVCKGIYESVVTLPGGGRVSKGAQARSEAAIHKAMKKVIPGVAEVSAEVMILADQGKSVRPYLDDLAQIAGPNIRCSSNVELGLRGREAVFIPGLGAYCIGEDAEAVAMFLAKDAKAQDYAKAVGGCQPIGALDANTMRRNYVNKYSKQKAEK